MVAAMWACIGIFQLFSMFHHPSLQSGALTDHVAKMGMGRSTFDQSKSDLSERASIPGRCRSINVGNNGGQLLRNSV
jgi:hypothetical protein